MKLLALLSLVTFNIQAANLSKKISPELEQKIIEHNKNLSQKITGGHKSSNILRPYAEYEKARYVLFHESTAFGSQEIKRTIAKNLPQGVNLVILGDSYDKSDVLKYYSKYLDKNRVQYLSTSSYGNGFWSRDSIPVPVFTKQNQLNLVDAKYYHSYEPDQEVANYFNVPLKKHSYYFEGGNFMADAKGNCVIVNTNAVSKLKDHVFKDYYGCSKTLRLPHIDGIGHIDERVKFVSDYVVLTDTPSYVSKLEGLGYEVRLLPRPNGSYETYVNSLLVNGTLFLPVFEDSQDRDAIQIYENLGFKVIPISSTSLSKGMGSIHCITMTYPDVAMFKTETTPFEEELIDAGIHLYKNSKELTETKNCVTKTRANLRKAPTTSWDNVIKTLDLNVPATALYESGDKVWYLVEAEGLRGWLHKAITLDCE